MAGRWRTAVSSFNIITPGYTHLFRTPALLSRRIRHIISRYDINQKVKLIRLAQCFRNVGSRKCASFVGVRDDESSCRYLRYENWEKQRVFTYFSLETQRNLSRRRTYFRKLCRTVSELGRRGVSDEKQREHCGYSSRTVRCDHLQSTVIISS